MIPKIIHYCWFGGKPLPRLARKCMASWKKFFPDCEIKEWNENNFDVNSIPYTREAYEAGKYAFVSDYARFKILYEEGGLYFDTDVEVIRPMDDIILRGPFMGCERNARGATVPTVNPGLGLGVNPGLGLYKKMLELYATLHFKAPDGKLNLKTIVDYTTEILTKEGLTNREGTQYVAGVYIYPQEYFCPIDYFTKKCRITSNTYSIHHYAESWVSTRMKIYELCNRILGVKTTKRIADIINRRK